MDRRGQRHGGLPPPLPKPYDFVRFGSGGPTLRAPVGHDRSAADMISGTIRGKIVGLSPVHVASGLIELTGSRPSLVKAHFRSRGQPTIPGSSLKGVLRSVAEAISKPPSCARITCARFDGLPPAARPCRDKEKLCLACRLFGAMGYMGRVFCHDATMIDGRVEVRTIPSMFAPRPRERVYFTGSGLRGRKFYMHSASPGETAAGNVPIEVCVEASFGLRVDFVDVSDAELHLLLTAMGLGHPPLALKLGGGKPACCGSVRLSEHTIARRDRSPLEFDPDESTTQGPAIAPEPNLVDAAALERLAELWALPGRNACPDRNY